jgi:hypothetical protein
MGSSAGKPWFKTFIKQPIGASYPEVSPKVSVEWAPSGQEFNDYTGRVFGRLTCIKYMGRKRGQSHGAIWLCRCSCDGNEKEYRMQKVRSGHTQSCGCFQAERTIARSAEKLGIRLGLPPLTRTCPHGTPYWCLECDPEQKIRFRDKLFQVAKASGVPVDWSAFDELHARWWAVWQSTPVALYLLTDPRPGELWEYGGATKSPDIRAVQHSAELPSTGRRAQVWLQELRLLGLKPKMTIQNYVPGDKAAEAETKLIMESQARVGTYNLNGRTKSGYAIRAYSEMMATPIPVQTYGDCQTPGCTGTATYKCGWCDFCNAFRAACRENARRNAGWELDGKTPRGTGTGVCHDCRGPCPLNQSRCESCKLTRRLDALDPRPCAHCGTMFPPKNPRQKYCSLECYHQSILHPLTAAEKSKRAQKASATQRVRGTGLFSPGARLHITHEEAVARGRAGGQKRQRNITPQQRREFALTGWARRRKKGELYR